MWAAALILDAVLGEPPRAVHPVVLIGRAISLLDRVAPRSGRSARLAGAVAAFAPALLAVLAVSVARPAAARMWLLKTTFALRELVDAAYRVESALAARDLVAAREAASQIVGRPTADLDGPLLASAAVESLAENLSDSYAAPLFWYAVGGLPAAMIYRAINTADAMIGHRTSRYRDVGRVAARADDLLNFVPARSTAIALALAAPLVGGDGRNALRVLARSGGATASPNSGRPMAALAGALDLRLEKRGHHVIGDGADPQAADIARARDLVLAAAGLLTLAYAVTRAR